MKIQSYQPIKYSPIYFQANNNKGFNLRQLARDVFQRTTTQPDAVKQTGSEISKKEIIAIYNEAFNFTLDHNPVMKKLDIQKPKLTFVDLGNSDACYDFYSNTIKIGTKYNEDLYAYAGYDENNELIGVGIALKDTIDNGLLQLKAKADKFRVYKLNPDEKKLYIKSVLVHELRHWTQEHLLASTKGCEEHIEYRLDLIKKMTKTYEEAIQLCESSGYKERAKNFKAALKQTATEYRYITNYKPKRILDEDFTLRTSCSFLENRYWSLKDHLLPASLCYKNSDDNEYKRNPIEIDAFNYQAEFLTDEQFSNRTKNIRDEVFVPMFLSSAIHGGVCLDNIVQYGYPPLIVKD